ncbi:hypothetical protein Lal_00038463 [Lupinus albus]|nr:hypothetical protein Lal_00038463 [Lupinus albus]
MRSNGLTGQAVVLKGNLAREIQQTRDRDKAISGRKVKLDLGRSPFTKKFTCNGSQSVADNAKKEFFLSSKKDSAYSPGMYPKGEFLDHSKKWKNALNVHAAALNESHS